MFAEIIEVFKNIDILQATLDTLIMVFLSTIISYIFGIPIAIISYITRKDGLKPNNFINKVVGIVINIGRSIPFIILLIALIPVSKAIVGTSIGVLGMIVPLSVGAIPFVARMVETSIMDINEGTIDAAKCMGMSNVQIIFKVLLRETIPSLIRGLSITAILLVGYSALSGTVGGDGLGSIAIEHGYYRFELTTMLVLLVLIIIIVQIIQFSFELIAKAVDKNKK